MDARDGADYAGNLPAAVLSSAGNDEDPMADAGTDTNQGSPFWRFSLRLYRQPGVADACIALQDECGVDVNALLFFLWLAADKKLIPALNARAVCEQAALWHDDVVAPLRAVRRKLKAGSTLIEANTAELFRTRIKAVELEAERLQQEALFAMTPNLETEPAESVEAAARANILAYEQAAARAFTPAAVEILIAAVVAHVRHEAGAG
jgi:uncharacterized protein (TIGR02444 family)